MNPHVQIGNVYESKDHREKGRQVRVVEEAVGKVGKWVCEHVRSRSKCLLGDKSLRERWTLVSNPEADTLQDLLRRMESVHPSDIAPSLVPLRKAWLKAGCPGLRKKT